jgi:hypothetical protein
MSLRRFSLIADDEAGVLFNQIGLAVGATFWSVNSNHVLPRGVASGATNRFLTNQWIGE